MMYALTYGIAALLFGSDMIFAADREASQLGDPLRGFEDSVFEYEPADFRKLGYTIKDDVYDALNARSTFLSYPDKEGKNESFASVIAGKMDFTLPSAYIMSAAMSDLLRIQYTYDQNVKIREAMKDVFALSVSETKIDMDVLNADDDDYDVDGDFDDDDDDDDDAPLQLHCHKSPPTGVKRMCGAAVFNHKRRGPTIITQLDDPRNLFMVYTVGPNGDLVQDRMLEYLEESMTLLMRVVATWNQRFKDGKIETLGVSLVGINGRSTEDQQDGDVLAHAVLKGIAKVYSTAKGVNRTKEVLPNLEFSWAKGHFLNAWEELKPQPV